MGSHFKEDYFKINQQLNIAERIFGSDYETIISCLHITHIAVYKTPLDGIYRSSPSKMREAFGKQWTSVDYHAFVLLKTSEGKVCLSLEKQRDGIYIGKSP